MIGRLRGILASKQPPWLVIDVGGVGYEVEAPMSTVFDLPETGREVALYVHYAAKEDTVSLYGFLRILWLGIQGRSRYEHVASAFLLFRRWR